MSTPKLGPKSKSTILQPRSLKSLNLPSTFQKPKLPSTLNSHNANEDEENEQDGGQEIRVLKRVADGRISKKMRRSYTQEEKLKALTMLQGTRTDEQGKQVPASVKWVSQKFGITEMMLRTWRNNEDNIVASKKGSRLTITSARKGVWHEMEELLHQKFLAVRADGKPVGKRWFIREGKKILDSSTNTACLFSTGWFQGFLSRWRISWRMKTKVSQCAPVDKYSVIQRFWQEIRRKSQPLFASNPHQICGRFPLRYIYNMDQTPLPFEFLQQRTYNTKGESTIWIKSKHISWTKRQATLMITAAADGEKQCRPILIFHGESGADRRPRREERLQYNPNVRVLFNPTAYSNEQITLEWIHKDLCSSSSNLELQLPQPERLVILDVFSGQMTPKTFESMSARNIVPVYIPDGCTGYVQPMDTIINKLVKDKMGEILEGLLEGEEVEVTDESIGRRRVLITHAIAAAWDWLHEFKKDSIIKAFQQAGISLNPDGSEDNKLFIRGIENPIVGEWQLHQPIQLEEQAIDIDEEVEFFQDCTDINRLPTHEPGAQASADQSRISISALCN